MSLTYLVYAISMIFYVTASSVNRTTNLKTPYTPFSFAQSSSNIINAKCFWIKNVTNVFDISDLQNTNSTDYKFSGKYLETINYNFCSDANKACNNKTGMVVAVYPLGISCKILAGSSDLDSTWALKNDSDPESGLLITLPQGEECAPNQFFTTTYELVCGNYTTPQVMNTNKVSMNSCSNTITIGTITACPKVNFYGISSLLLQYYYLFGTVIIIVGLFLLYLGLKFVKVTIIVVVTFSVMTVVSLVVFSIHHFQSNTAVWVVLGVTFALGLALSYFLITMTKVVTAMIGGYCGYILGNILYSILLRYIKSNPDAVYWITIVASIVLFALLTLWFVKTALTIATTIVGGYGVIRGASLYIGYFPSEIMVVDLIRRKEYSELEKIISWPVYIYMLVWVLLVISGIIVQFKLKKKEGNDEYDNDYKTKLYNK